MSCTKESLKLLKKRLEDIISSSSSYNKVTTDSLRELFVTLNELQEYEEVYCYRLNHGFVIFENVHIVDINRLKTSLNSTQISDETLKSFLLNLIQGLEQLDEIKTKRGDKLYTICPITIDEYCPICSFIGLTKISHNFDLLENPEIRLSPDIIDFTVSLDTILELLNKNIYTIKNSYLPAIVYDDRREEAKLKIIKLTKKESEILLAELVEHLKVDGTSIGDINSFAFKVSFNEDIPHFEFIDIDDYFLSKNQLTSQLINNLKPKLLKSNFNSIIFGSKVKIEWINKISPLLSNFINSLKEELEIKYSTIS